MYDLDEARYTGHVTNQDSVAGRKYGRVYTVSGKKDIHDFIADAVKRSGGKVLYQSSWTRAPLFLGIQTPSDERVGLLVYPFRANHNVIRNRPKDEHRFQVRYGGEKSWSGDHTVARDIAGVDTTLVLGVHLEYDLFIGVDPALYDPLPMGISIEVKDHQLVAARKDGWLVFERENRGGRRRQSARAPEGLETVVIFGPERLLDYARLERKASDLGLDQPLRYAAAQSEFAAPPSVSRGGASSLHALEQEFELAAAEILEIIASRTRLTVAVRGGVAENHLERVLGLDPDVLSVKRLDVDAMHDFNVQMRDGRELRVECKNASPARYKDGAMKVEVQKTRSSKGDPASRLYRVDQFDVIAACLYSPTREWTFRFQNTAELVRDKTFAERIAPIQRIGDDWTDQLGRLP